jgi:hypothetical protein
VGIVLTVVVPTTPGLPVASLMERLVTVTGAGGLLAGWAMTLGGSAVPGAIFGALLAGRGRDTTTVATVALSCGLALWVVNGVIGVPLLYGAPPVVGLARLSFGPILIVMLLTDLIFFSALAVLFLGLSGRGPREPGDARDLRRAA